MIATSVSGPKQVKRLSSQQQLAMSLRFQGKTLMEIATALNVSFSSVSHWFGNSGRLKNEYTKFCQNVMNPKVTPNSPISVAETIKAAAPRAIQNIIELGNNAKREQVKLIANQDIADRAGFAPVHKTFNVDVVEEMSIEQLDAYVDNLLERGAANVPAIEPATVEPVAPTPDATATPDATTGVNQPIDLATGPDTNTPSAPIYKEGRSDITENPT